MLEGVRMTSEALSAALNTARVFAGDIGPIGQLADAYIAIYNAYSTPHEPLTPCQRKIFDFLVRFIDDHGYAPSLSEIATAFNYRALATVHEHLTSLERKGWIRRWHNSERAIEILVGAA
jgi:DNA-binding MarR family transcriptional regulator